MPIIFGKKSSLPGACGVCGRVAGPYGVTNMKYAKPHEVMWVCNDCVGKDKWERIYSMSSVKLTEIEERCIGIAVNESEISQTFQMLFFHVVERICASQDHKDLIVDPAIVYKYVDGLKKDGSFLHIAKKLLTGYQNQLKKFNN